MKWEQWTLQGFCETKWDNEYKMSSSVYTWQVLIPKVPHGQTTDASLATAVLNQAFNRQWRKEKSEGQENKIIIVSRQPRKRNKIGALVTSQKDSLSGFKSKIQSSMTIDRWPFNNLQLFKILHSHSLCVFCCLFVSFLFPFLPSCFSPSLY